MSREEEIKKAAKNRADQYEHHVDWNNCYHHFIQGAEWADKHKKKEFWDAEKVCKYLKEHAGHYMTLENDEEGELQAVFNKKRLVEDLRKAMEE